MKMIVAAPVLLALGVLAANGQSVISAHSGVVHYVEGRVLVNEEVVDSKVGNFPAVGEKQLLRTEEGRAEVLLTPGVFLRVGENSAIRMISNRLIDTRVEFLSGSIMVEAADLPKDNAVTIVYKDYTIGIPKKGVYAFNSDPAVLRVYQGEALAELGGRRLEVKEGKLLPFDGELALAKFDEKEPNGLFAWSRRRSEALAVANVYAARSLSYSGYGWNTGGWMLNPFLGMYSFIPANGVYFSPFGYAFWSPFSVHQAYVPGFYYNPGYYSGGSRSGGGGSASHSPYASHGPGRIGPAHGAAAAAAVGRPSGSVHMGGGGFSHGGASMSHGSISSGGHGSISSGGHSSGGGVSHGGGGSPRSH